MHTAGARAAPLVAGSAGATNAEELRGEHGRAQAREPPTASDTERKRKRAQPKASAITHGGRGTNTEWQHDQAGRTVASEAPTTYRAMAMVRGCSGHSTLRRGAVDVGASTRACRTTGGASGGVGGGTNGGQKGARG